MRFRNPGCESLAQATAITKKITAGETERLWVWAIRSGLSVGDQGFTSGSGFLLNVLLARWLSAEAYGAFAVAFAGFLFVAGFHNVLLLEPMSVMGPAAYVKRLPAYFASQFRVHVVLVGPLSILLLLAGAVMALRTFHSPLVGALIGSGVALPLMLGQWVARRMCYIVQRPSAALIPSGLYFVFILGGLLGLRSLGVLNPFTAFLLVAMASAITSLLMLREMGVLKTFLVGEGVPSWRQTLGENYIYGRWLIGTTILSNASSQAQTFLAAGFLGLGAAGILRAMQLPALVMTQIVIATTLLVLPSISYEYGRGNLPRLRKKAAVTSAVLTTLALCYVGVLLMLAAPAEHVLFGGKYASHAWLIPLLGLVPVFTGFTSGMSMALHTLRKSQFELLAYVVAAAVGLTSSVFFMKWWGVAGAAGSIALGSATLAVSTGVCYLAVGSRESRRVDEYSSVQCREET